MVPISPVFVSDLSFRTQSTLATTILREFLGMVWTRDSATLISRYGFPSFTGRFTVSTAPGLR